MSASAAIVLVLSVIGAKALYLLFIWL
ncbi:MAG: hypothetical protein QOG35_197, partial [Solirubrobacteraceae bacterium]|nr:hypothetical protein [Solirubrobacteraceae bacterium]